MWLVGVVSRRCVWLVGGTMAALWLWLQCIGVVSAYCCKEVYRYPQINY